MRKPPKKVRGLSQRMCPVGAEAGGKPGPGDCRTFLFPLELVT